MSSRSTTNGGLLATLLHESKSFPLRQLLLAAISLWLLCSSPPCLVASAPSDVVVFLSDDHCQLDCSPYEEVWIHTPNMQRLAESGLAFTRAYVASPSCAPSRVALLTGLMPRKKRSGSNWPHVPWLEKDPSYDPDRLLLPARSIDTPEKRAWTSFQQKKLRSHHSRRLETLQNDLFSSMELYNLNDDSLEHDNLTISASP